MPSKPRGKRYREKDNPYFDYKKTGGRHAMILNEDGLDLVTKLATIHCSIEEIAAFLNCDPTTLWSENNRNIFNTAYTRGKMLGNVKIRQKLADKVNKGSDKCIIFSCKAILGMSDTIPPSYESSALDGLVKAMDRIREDDEDGEEPPQERPGKDE